jgi:hypothetical protein
MKFTKTIWIFLIAGILTVAVVYMVVVRTQQTEQQAQIQERLSLAQKKLALMSNDEVITQKDRLTQEIEEYQARMVMVKKQLTSQEDSISVSGLILKIAGGCGVNIVNISSPGKGSADLYGTSCSTLPVGIEAGGDYGNIRDFVAVLSREFPTSLVSMVQASTAASPLSPSPGPASETQGLFLPVTAGPVTATINLVIYSYEGK